MCEPDADGFIPGEICRIIADRGFFFIKGDDGQQYFAHRDALMNRLWIYDIKEEDRVKFKPQRHQKGPRATSIIVLRLAQDEE